MVKGAMGSLLAIAFLAVGCGGGDDQTEENRDTGAGGTAAGAGGTAAGTGGTAAGAGGTAAGAGGTAAGTGGTVAGAGGTAAGAGGTAAGAGGTAAGTGGTASGGGETRASEVVGRWDIDRGGYADCGAEPTEWDTTIPGGPGFEFRLSGGQLTAGQCLGGATCSTGTYTDYRFELDEMGFVKARTRLGSIELDGMCYASRSTAVLQLLEGGQRLRYVETLERAPSASLGDGDCSEEPEGEYSCGGIEVREMIPYEG